MKLSEELKWRGFVNQTTLADIAELDKTPVTFYWGVDPSADSMTIGHLSVAMTVKRFMRQGHKAVLLVGGATGLIGDPDGKKQERDLKSPEEIAKNKAVIVEQYKKIFEGEDFEVVDNYDWFKDVGYMDFLRNIGKHLSMTQLLDREFVKARIGSGGSGISYAEFSYSLIQGYDFLHLFREKGVTLQVCGADQWGNSLVGVEMIRKLEAKEAHVYSTPLIINKTTGIKFGKSEEGAVWLDENKTSVYQFYQFWLNVDDDGAINYLKIYTPLSKEKIEELEQAAKSDPADRLAQKTLAYEVTKIVHGEAKAKNAKKVTEVLFGGQHVSQLSHEEQVMLSHEIPVAKKGSTLTEILAESGVAASKGEARRLLEGGAISVNSQKVTTDETIREMSLVKKGKNQFILVN